MEQLSETPSAMSHLSPEKKKRLSDLLEQHMTGLESGLPLCVEPNLQDDPEILVAFRDCVSVIEKLHSMASGFPTDEPLEASGRQGSSLNNANSEASECSSRRLGDFQLHDEIGRGGMGVVYRATQLSLKRIVAIKLLTCANKFDWRQISRFQLEAEAAGSLQHPHIVPVIAVGCELGVHFYAMQFIDGRSMDEIIHLSKEQSSTESFFKRPDWQTSVLQAIQAAEGLHAAHELGVIHRDVKPSNLIVDQSGKTWVTDFGLARVQSDVSLTQSGDIVGTMKYMSPEQARGDSAIVDGRADVYSLGVTLYEMLTLKPAHDGRDIPTVLRMIDEDAHTSPRTLRPDLPRDLETVILHAMAKNRDDRYETAKAFADDLRHVLAGEPTIARPPTFGDRIARYANKHRRSFAVSLSAGVIALIGFACFTVLLAAEKRISDTNARRAAVNESRALRNEKIARESIERLGSQMAELLSDIPAAAPVRRRLLSETLDYYQRFASDIGHDPSLRKDLAITHGKIGTCQKELGSSDEAVAALCKSEMLFSELASESPLDASLQLQWSISQNNLAEQLVSDGKLQQAAVWFDKAIANQRNLVALFPNNAEVQSVQGGILNNLGFLQKRLSNFHDANQSFIDAIMHQSRAVQLAPEIPRYKVFLSKHQYNLKEMSERI